MKILLLGILFLTSVVGCDMDLKSSVKRESHTPEKRLQEQLSSKILFSMKNGNDRGWSIYSINPDGTDMKILVPFKSGQGEYNPAMSPDGKTVLFNTYRYGGWKLATYDLETKKSTRITKSSNYYTNGVYSPSGNQIAYEKNVDRSTHIFVADKDGRNEKILTRQMGNENRVPAWTPDGKSVLFYSDKSGSNDIYQVTIANGSIRNLTQNISGNDFGPSVSPNGKSVSFYSDREGHLDLFVMDLSGNNQVNLTKEFQNAHNEYGYYTDNNLFWIFKNSWSPTGEEIVFSNSNSENINLFTINKDGSNMKQITNSSKSIYTPAWAMVRQ